MFFRSRLTGFSLLAASCGLLCMHACMLHCTGVINQMGALSYTISIVPKILGSGTDVAISCYDCIHNTEVGDWPSSA